MALFVHSTASLVRAECVCTSLILTATDVPSLVCVDAKYLNWQTSSSVFPFISFYIWGII